MGSAVSTIKKIFNAVASDYFLERDTISDNIEVAYVSITLANEELKLDPAQNLVSLEIVKKGNNAFTFSLELFDPTFKIDKLLLGYQVPIKICYGDYQHNVSYSGMITTSAATVHLSVGSDITCTGYLTQSLMTNNDPVLYSRSMYKGSVLAIIHKATSTQGMDLLVRDDIEDVILQDDSYMPLDVYSETTETTIQFLERMVKELGQQVGYMILPAGYDGSSRNTFVVYKTNNSTTELTKSRQRIIMDLNHRDSIVSEYSFEIKQTQFEIYGREVEVITPSDHENRMIKVVSSVETDDNPKEVTDLLSEGNQRTSKVRVVESKARTVKRTKLTLEQHLAKNIDALYKVNLELTIGLPDLIPFVTEVELYCWITTPESGEGSVKHHTSGVYTVTEARDTIKDGVFTTSLVAVRAPANLKSEDEEMKEGATTTVE